MSAVWSKGSRSATSFFADFTEFTGVKGCIWNAELASYHEL